MKEIKFKVWNKENRTMRVVDVLLLTKGAEYAYTKTGKEREVVAATTYSDEILMQYTGLKDKNGKEIYFGDVVEMAFKDEEDVYQGTALIVETMSGGAGILFDYSINDEIVAVEEGGEIQDVWEDGTLWEIEIIGNQFENPELINKTNDNI
ncbi:MAG: hypothetical protein KGI27_12925 [Thaumarchaeota archaeon]|nr:hypothetical protein [Nitrososphaerota archaeon]